MRRAIPLIFVLLLLPLATASGDSPRAWTDATGRFSIQASFVDAQDAQVRLRKADGTTISIPLDRLSEADRQFVANAPKVIQGEVVAIADGDTLTVLDAAKTQHKIRLEGIDTPESNQAFGSVARKSLADKVFRESVHVEWREKDRYGRTLGHVFLGNRWINKELVAEGMAWHYKEYNKDRGLAEAETQAKQKRVGLWADAEPIPPWEYRRGVRPQTAAKPPPEEPKPQAADTTVYVTRTGEKYHTGSCRHLSKSKISVSLNEARGRYGPCSVCNPPR